MPEDTPAKARGRNRQSARNGRRALTPADVQLGLLVLAVLYTIYLARPFLLPITLAVVLALALRPMVRFLKRAGLPQPLAAALLVLAMVFTLVFAINRVYEPALDWADKAPRILRQLQYKLSAVTEPMNKVGEAAEEVEKITEPDGQPSKAAVEVKQPGLRASLFKALRSIAAGAVIVIFLLFFLLAWGERLMTRIVDAILQKRDSRESIQLLQQTESFISRYLLTITVINTGLGAIIMLAMWALGMPNPLLWGIMAALLNFVPYLGAITGVVVISIVSLLSFDSTAYALSVPLVYLCITGLEGLLVTPLILGQRFALEPIVIFIWLIFLGWLWGIGGVLLAMPLLTIIKLVLDHSEKMSSISLIMGKPDKNRRPASKSTRQSSPIEKLG